MTDDKRRKSQEMNDGSPAIDKQDLQERILRGIKPNVGEMTGKWVVDLSEGGAGEVSVPTTFDEERASKFPDDMRTWVDKLFDDFQRYIFEYNKAIDPAEQELQIDAERPNFVKDANPNLQQLKYHSQQQVQGASIFQGHLYTRHWALLIRGEENNVKAFVLPVDFLIAFDTRKGEFKPYFEMRGARNKRGLMIWYVDAVPISYEALGAVSKALFGALVKATREELGDQERFKLASAQKEDQETTDTESFVRRYTLPPGSKAFLFSAEGQTGRPQAATPMAPVAPPRPAMFQSSPVPAPAQGSNPAIAPLLQPGAEKAPQQPGQQFQQPGSAQVAQSVPAPNQPQFQSQANPFQQLYQGQQPSVVPQQQPRPVSQTMQPPTTPQPQYQLSPQPQMPAQQQQVPASPQQHIQTPQQMPSSKPPAAMPSESHSQGPALGQEDVNARLQENFVQVVASCQNTSQVLQSQMELLTKIGVSALHQQSMDGVMQVMKRTNSLKNLREKLDAFVQEWNNLQSSK